VVELREERFEFELLDCEFDVFGIEDEDD